MKKLLIVCGIAGALSLASCGGGGADPAKIAQKTCDCGKDFIEILKKVESGDPSIATPEFSAKLSETSEKFQTCVEKEVGDAKTADQEAFMKKYKEEVSKKCPELGKKLAL